MSFTDFRLHLDGPHAIFYAGQEVSGHITFQMTKEKRMRGVEVKFHGEAFVHWREKRRTSYSKGLPARKAHSYSNRETYFDQWIYVLGGPDQDMTLPAGSYSYPFRFMLPSNIPSSFEGAHGHVRYVVRGRVNRPRRFDHKCKRVFTVLCPLDLNTELSVQEPYHTMKEKVLSCGCCSSEAITFVVSLPFRGFVPGQQSKAVVDVENPTTKGITIKCNLVQKIIFKASCGRTKNAMKTIEKETLGSLQGRGTLSRQSYLKIPSVPASFLQFCNCIDITYTFQVCGVLTGMHRDAKVEVPITIGTIPLRNQFAFIVTPDPQMPSAPELPPAGPSDKPLDPSAPPPYTFQQYPDMPPPSYEECMSGKVNTRTNDDDEYVQGDMEFAPRYPIYHFK